MAQIPPKVSAETPADSSAVSSRTPPPKMVVTEPSKAPPPKAPTPADSTPAVAVPRVMMTDPFTGASFNLKGKGKGSDPSPIFVDFEALAETCRQVLADGDISQMNVPDGCRFVTGWSPKKKLHLTLKLNLETSWRNKRVHGFIVHIQKLNTSANTTCPAMSQLIVKIPFTNAADKTRRNVFARVLAFSSHFAPKSAETTHLMLGDLITGAIEAPHSEKHSTGCLVGWRRAETYFDSQLELNQLGPGVTPGGIQLNPNMLWNLPTLGADSFAASPNDTASLEGQVF